MKRVGVQLRDCDSRYLSGRPSFTLSSWGEQMNLKTVSHTISDPDHGVSKAPTKVRAKASVPGSTSADAGALGGFIEAKTVYTSASLPLLAHVWPTITASPGRTSPVRSPRKVSPSKSAPGLSHPFVERKESLDPYAAGGTRFRASFSGNQVSVHSGGLNTDGLTPKMRNDFEKSRSAHKEQRKAKESKRKNAWNPTPHVVPQRSAVLSDPSPFKKISYDQFHEKKLRKQAKTTKASYTNAPFQLPKFVPKFVGHPPLGSITQGAGSPPRSPQPEVANASALDTFEEEEEPDEQEEEEKEEEKTVEAADE